MLCVGLDVDFNKMPEHVKALANKGELAIKGELYKGKARSIIEFNKAIIDATAPHCVAYKPNVAFYECYGIDGMRCAYYCVQTDFCERPKSGDVELNLIIIQKKHLSPSLIPTLSQIISKSCSQEQAFLL